MKKLLSRITLLVMVSLCGLTSQAAAENRAGAFTLSPMGGIHAFDGKEDFQTSGLFSLGLGYNFTKNWGMELVGTTANVKNKVAGAGDFNYWTARADLLYHLRPEENLVPYLAVGVGEIYMDTGAAVDVDPLFNYGVGVKYFLTDWLALRLDARHAFRHQMQDKLKASGEYYNNFLFTGGLSFQLGGKQEDTVAPIYTAEPKVIPALDSDADGVIDRLDRCAGTAAGIAVDADGCPLDSDGDGVVDAADQCPATPAGTEVNLQGCEPIVAVPVLVDTDADGVADADDKCPDTPSMVAVDELGCPLDTDSDGVIDSIDSCPETEVGQPVTADGCAVVTPPEDELKLEIIFASNSSAIAPQYMDQLQAAADFIKSHPGIKFVVEGHTDGSGSAAGNLRLSQKRADTVRWFLFRDFGVDRFSLTAKGFGEEQPLADNATPEGRAINRRVLVKALD